MGAALFIFKMLMYTFGGGLYIGLSVLHFEERHPIRGGIYSMFALSLIFCMADTVFRFGGMPL